MIIRTGILGVLCMMLFCVTASAAETIFLYGPGGPAPAMKEAAQVFGKLHNANLEVTAGPTPQWIGKAKNDADIIYSGAEYMMTDFIVAMEGRIDTFSVNPLYMRPSAILVRPGNPKNIKGFKGLLSPGIKVVVVQGAGQTGMWEDVAGKQGDIDTVKAFRKNIVAYAPNSAEAKKVWIERPDIDAWLIYNIWQIANPTIADLVSVEKEHVIYRDCGIALTAKGKANPLAQQFVTFIQSKEGARIFKKWGWIVPD